MIRLLAASCSIPHGKRKQAGLLAPFAVAQRWHQLTQQHKLLENCTLAASVALGGDFGLTGAPALEGAGVAGMIKSLLTEMRYSGAPSFRTRSSMRRIQPHPRSSHASCSMKSPATIAAWKSLIATASGACSELLPTLPPCCNFKKSPGEACG